jgi:N-hydroxyarylamine O-acetyltransferase
VTRQLPPPLAAYLARIGAAHPHRADPATLQELQLHHLLTVPFENLSIHLDESIVLDPEALVDKVVRRRRGGFCYELNGAFATLLAGLGFPVTLLAARVFGADGLGPPFDHLALRVDLDSSGSWLVDVGFGRHSHYPLRLDTRTDQADPGGTFWLADTADGDLDVIRDGQPQYRVEARPRTLADFEPTCWWHQTSPRSHFTQGPVCSRLTEAGRVTLSDRTLVHTTGDRRQERTLTDDAEVLAAYRTWFGIVLERVPDRPAATPTAAPAPARPR